MPKKEENEIIEAEQEAVIESDSDTEEEAEVGMEETDENELEATAIKKAVGDVSAVPAEVAALNTDNETAQEASKNTGKTVSQKKFRSKRYASLSEMVDKGKKYPIDEAIELAKSTSNTKFAASVELHIKISEKKGKKKGTDELARGIFHLPHGLGKALKVAVLDETMIDQIFKTKKVDFDVAVATPALMSKLGKVAKILGPKGKMPNPKTGTVTDDPGKVKAEIEKGKVEYKVDANNVIHQMIGKASWENDKIRENMMVVLQALPKNRIQSVAITTTMGPGIKIEY